MKRLFAYLNGPAWLDAIIFVSAALLCIYSLTGCASAANGRIVSISNRMIGIDVETATLSNGTGSPTVRLGFLSSVVRLIPAETNAVYAPAYGDTFDTRATINPFDNSISESAASGNELVGTNSFIRPVIPK